MAMTKEQKVAAVDALSEKLAGSTTIYLTNYSGLTVDQANNLRSKLREAGVEYQVVKNTFLRLAMERLGGYDEIFDLLIGPTGVAFTEEPAAPARVFKNFLKDTKLEVPELKGAYVDGAIFGSTALDELASLKSKEELISDIVGLLMAPISNIVGGLEAQGGNLVGAIKTIAESGEA